MESIADLIRYDPREMFPEIPEVVCMLCESGYHDHAWEVNHVMRCGCPCHGAKLLDVMGNGNRAMVAGSEG